MRNKFVVGNVVTCRVPADCPDLTFDEVYTISAVSDTHESVKVLGSDRWYSPNRFDLCAGKQEQYYEVEDIKDTKRYALKSDKQLMQVMREDLLSDEEFRGAMKFNIFKYGIRYPKKNGVKDLEKAREYIDELIDFEKEIEANVQKEETNHCDA